MYVETLATTRVGDREYTLEATKGFGSEFRDSTHSGETVSYRVVILQDEEGAGTHDRVIAAAHGSRTRREAQAIWRLLVEVALHHGPEAFED